MASDKVAGAVVPDASVILKWVLDSETEPGHAAAGRLLERWREGEVDLFVPPLWLYEVGNVLCLKRPGDAADAMAALCGLGLLEVTPGPELVARTVGLAVSHGLTFYDASYLAVAEQRQALLITADAKLHRRLPPGLAAELLG